jgi:hypothetical protein
MAVLFDTGRRVQARMRPCAPVTRETGKTVCLEWLFLQVILCPQVLIPRTLQTGTYAIPEGCQISTAVQSTSMRNSASLVTIHLHFKFQARSFNNHSIGQVHLMIINCLVYSNPVQVKFIV